HCRIEQKGGRFILCLYYNEKYFFGHRFTERLKHVSDQIIKGTQYLPDLEFHFEDEYRQIQQWNNTSHTYKKKTVAHMFEEQVQRTPDRIALANSPCRGQRRHYTYNELNILANSLAHTLKQKGVGSDTIVGLKVEPSVDMLAGILGILKAGGAFLPIDPQCPQQRIDYMLADCNARILADDEFLRRRAPMCLSEARGERDTCVPTCPPIALKMGSGLTDLAYIIYTSGSTGKPKGVAVQQDHLSDYVQTFIDRFQITAHDRVLQQISYTFDASVEEIYPVLCQGGALVFSKDSKDLPGLVEEINRHAITVVSTSPAVVNYFNGVAARLHHLRILISGGDELKPGSVDRLLENSAHTADAPPGKISGNLKIYNTYGPTESTVCITYYQVTGSSGSSIPIGKPITNRKVYILDNQKRLLPPGIAGELCVSGAGVTRGYLNKPELTAEQFIRDSRQLAVGSWQREASRQLAVGCRQKEKEKKQRKKK
ncbi:MAG: amino acid adenylation domain-containing protein, partial [bacterium]|nr:amino acid adenylation domain-containing protein [bacterium]